MESSDGAVHGFATRDETYDTLNMLLWNYSATPAHARVKIEGAADNLMVHPLVMDAAGPSDDENARLRPLAPARLGDFSKRGVDLEPWGMAFFSLEKR